jgi:hypothetical protein
VFRKYVVVMDGTESEAFVDECLQKARSMANMMEAISRLWTPKPSASNSPMTEEEDLQHSHRLNLRTRQLSEDTRIRLVKIKRELNPYYHQSDIWQIVEDLINRCSMTGDYAFLDAALEYYKQEAKNNEMSRSYSLG